MMYLYIAIQKYLIIKMSTPPPPPIVTPPTPIPTGLDWDYICDIIGWIGTAIGIGLNISPIILFWKVLRKIEKKDIIPESMLIFNILCSLLWATYWLRKVVFVACFSSSVGTILSIIFSIVYLYVTFEDSIFKFLVAAFIDLDICAQLYYILVYIVPDVEYIGTVAMVVNIINYAAPGQNILKVIKEGDYKLIPIVTTLFGAACSLSWLSFGILKRDINCIVPNSLGMVFSVVNISIWTIFYLKRKPETEDKDAKVEELKEREGQEP